MPVDNQEIKIEGFDQLQKKIKQLPDNVKRREILKIQRQIAKPVIQAYKVALPKGNKDVKRFNKIYPAGTLSNSVRAKTVPASKVGGQPSIVIRPGKRGKWDPWYRFMVIPKGGKPGSRKEGSRINLTNVVEKARDRAWETRGEYVTKKYQEQVARYIQKQIDKLL